MGTIAAAGNTALAAGMVLDVPGRVDDPPEEMANITDTEPLRMTGSEASDMMP